MSFNVYPAIDVRAGRVVRLCQGDYERQTTYPADPLELAAECARQGAEWLHLVDLDAARDGGYSLLPLLRRIVERTGLKVQTGGGIRGERDVSAVLDAGAVRVVVGSMAVRDPVTVVEWISRFGSDRITVALDTRRDDDGQWRLPSHGWTAPSSRTLDALATTYAASGLQHLLCTDIGRDGMLAGPAIDLYRDLCASVPGLQVQASGGVRDAGDVAAVRAAGCAGVVLGKALLDGRMSLDEACAPC